MREWKKCRHPDHGYETCKDKSFGEIYFDCASFSRGDITQHLNTVPPLVDIIANAMLSHKSVIAFRQSSEIKVHCVIKRNEDLPFAGPVLSDMKRNYKVIFGKRIP